MELRPNPPSLGHRLYHQIHRMVQSTTLPLTLLHILLTTIRITIGITPEILQPTTPVGPPHQAISQYTTLVQPVGVFLTEVEMVYGQRRDLMILHPIGQIEGYLSASHHLPQLGILLRVIATAAVAACTMLVTTATIGLPLLTATTRAAWTSPTMAASICLANTVARTATQSAVSKNNSKSACSGNPCVAGLSEHAFCGLPLAPGLSDGYRKVLPAKKVAKLYVAEENFRRQHIRNNYKILIIQIV